MRRSILMMGLVVAVTGVLAGCGLFSVKEEKYAQELAADGMEAFQDGNYREAVTNFEKLKDWYPFSKYAILAELKIADAYYQLQEYEDAVHAYESFENLHPRNEATPYVVYQIGMCYFDQIETIDRDQTNARKALESFQRLQTQYGKSEYAAKAEVNINKCLKNLAAHDFYVGLFYYNGKHYKAALQRFKSVVTNYPDVGIHRKAIKYIALCEEKSKAVQP